MPKEPNIASENLILFKAPGGSAAKNPVLITFAGSETTLAKQPFLILRGVQLVRLAFVVFSSAR